MKTQTKTGPALSPQIAAKIERIEKKVSKMARDQKPKATWPPNVSMSYLPQ